MNSLLYLDRRYGMATSLVGSISGFGSWLLAHAPDITSVAGMIGAVATAAIALLALAVKVYGFGCRMCAWARIRRRNAAVRAEQRRQHQSYDPPPFDAGNQDD